METFPTALDALHVCAWRTVSLTAGDVANVEVTARASHARAAIVSSCQRTEAYGLGTCECRAETHLAGRDALAHLAGVAAGLESVVLGEAQILGQVREAFADADAPLRALGDVAIAAARELRRRTRFNSHAGHLLDRSLAVAGVPASGRLLVLGTGAMGRLVADRGVELGFDEVIVAGRTPPMTKGEHRWSFASLEQAGHFAPVDVIAGCLGSGAGETPFGALPGVRGLVIDLGTPRNFGDDAPCRSLTIADLLADERGQPHRVRRRAELAAALERILDVRLAYAAEDSRSAVGTLRSAVEGVRQRELARACRLHPEVAPETLDALTRSLVNQIFHEPSKRLKEIDDRRLSGELAALFS
ncbi:MAG: hypothetical protein ACRDG3_04395 [Tepidiformaceae bacterium]